MAQVKLGIIGGTGLGDALGIQGELVNPDTPFGKPSAPILRGKWHGQEIAILKRHGEGHVFPPSFVPYRANIFALKLLGVTHLLASGATGSLREDIHPGDLVIADQVIDKTYRRPGTFFERAAVHVEFAQPFCPVMRQWLLQAAGKLPKARIHPTGTYVCMEGPAFSTVAESRLHRGPGFDGHLIGMTAMPEAKLAREAEIAYALIGLPTDYDCWKPHDAGVAPQQLLSEILGNLKLATQRGLDLIQAALTDMSLLAQRPSPAHQALQLAIWSDKTKIPAEEVERLRPLWGKYFP